MNCTSRNNKHLPDQQLMKAFIPQKSPREDRTAWNSSEKLSRPIKKETITTSRLQKT